MNEVEFGKWAYEEKVGYAMGLPEDEIVDMYLDERTRDVAFEAGMNIGITAKNAKPR